VELFDSNYFTLLKLVNSVTRGELEAAFTTKKFAGNEVVYKAGEVADSVYIVVTGVVEAITVSPDGKQSRSVAFMERGDFFGDLGVLTGQPRLATIRTCEPTTALHIEKNNFLLLLEKVPKLAVFFTRNIARRLYRTSTVAHLQVFSLDLAGNLQHFDMLTIFQAITHAGRTGELYINNSSNDLIGSFFFREGRVEHARFQHLLGLEAVWQGFVQSTTDGTFTFQVLAEPTLTFAPEHAITLESNDLLMQGVGKRDLFIAMPEDFRNLKGKLSRRVEALQWTDPATAQVAERIWELIAKRPQTVESLWRRLGYSAITLLETICELGRLEQVSWELEPPPPPPVEAAPSEPKLPTFPTLPKA